MSSESLAQSSLSTSEGSSWNSWFQKAKIVTANALDFVKNDLEEFSTALTDQTTSAVNSIKMHVPKMESAWIKGFMNSVNDFLNLEDQLNNCDNAEKLNIPKVCPNSIKKSWSRLFPVQSDPCTYGDEPRGAPELFEDWLDHFNLKDKKEEINDLLRFNPLVPEQISNGLFWQRYFYKVHQFELDESRRKTLKKLNKTRSFRKKGSSNHKDSWSSDFNELDINALDISSDISITKTNLYTKSKSSVDVSKNDYSTTPNVKFFRRHKSPSLDIEIKEAELIAQGLLPRRESCSSLENISWNSLVFDSSEDHSNYCKNLCRSVKCEIPYLKEGCIFGTE